MTPEEFIESVAEGQGDEVERFSAELARRVADLLKDDVFRIDEEAARLIADENHGGWSGYLHMGGGYNPLALEYELTKHGHVRLNLQLPNGVSIWRATLRP